MSAEDAEADEGDCGGSKGEAAKGGRTKQSKRKEAAFLRCMAEGCGKTFLKKSCLQRHMLSHSEERQFSCSSCSAAFKRKEHLERHEMLRHSKHAASSPAAAKANCSKEAPQEQPQSILFECEFCGKRFLLNYHLRRHRKTHMLLCKCQVCGEGFARKRQLRRHMLLHLVSRQSASAAAPEAQPSSPEAKNPSEATQHQGGAAADKPQPADTSADGEAEAAAATQDMSASPMADDLQLSSAEGFKCPHTECGKTFSSLDQLYRHLRRAAQRKRDYKCAVCGAAFAVFSALVSHKRSVHSSKVHACEHCGKAFTRLDRLKAHVKTKHFTPEEAADGEDLEASVDAIGAFQCSECSLSFTSKSNLRVHVRVKHLNERRFSCLECGMRFAYKAVLRRHMSSMHRGAALRSGQLKKADGEAAHPSKQTAGEEHAEGEAGESETSEREGESGEGAAAAKAAMATVEPQHKETTVAKQQEKDTPAASLAAPNPPEEPTEKSRFLVDAVSVNLVALEGAAK
ncbi:hypothetical protein Efla_007251 [Eimeria flavescens]